MNFHQIVLKLAEATRLLKIMKDKETFFINNYPKKIEDIKHTNYQFNHYNYFFEILNTLIDLISSIDDDKFNEIKGSSHSIKILLNDLTMLFKKNESELSLSDKAQIVELSFNLANKYLPFKDELKILIKSEQALINKTTHLIIKPIPNKNFLFHAIKEQYAQEVLERGSILGYTTHRYWDNGKRYKDNQPEYEENYWMKGVSLTRSLDFAINWGVVVLVFNRDEIAKNYQLENYNWGNHLAQGSGNIKKETEEFLVLSKKDKTYRNRDNSEFMKEYREALEGLKNVHPDEIEEYKSYIETLEKDIDKINIQDIKKPEGEFNFSKSLVGIIVSLSSVEIFGLNNPMIQTIINHPKFLGILDR